MPFLCQYLHTIVYFRNLNYQLYNLEAVTPHVGVWIETAVMRKKGANAGYHPHAEAWNKARYLFGATHNTASTHALKAIIDHFQPAKWSISTLKIFTCRRNVMSKIGNSHRKNGAAYSHALRMPNHAAPCAARQAECSNILPVNSTACGQRQNR